MLKYVFNLLNKLAPKDVPTPLGRWRTETCNKALNTKIDLSNEDHCGPCGQYALEKRKVNKDINIKVEKHH